MIEQASSQTRLIFALALLLANDTQGEQGENDFNKPAVFKVNTEVVNSNVLPFTATLGGFGNTLIQEGSAFEPVVFRNKFIALEDSPDRIVANPDALSRYDSLREGFLDQATVHIYRIEDGRFKMVREGRVATGGAHASGWVRAMEEGKVVAPGATRSVFRWDNWNRPHAKYYFTVRAIDQYGNLSPAAPAVTVTSPEKGGDGAVTNTLVTFKPVKALFPPKPLPAPKSLRGKLGSDGMLTLEWTPVDSPDLAGYVIYRSDYPPHAQSGYYLQLADKPISAAQDIKAGDMVMVSKKLYSTSRDRYFTNRVWGAASEYKTLMPGLMGFFPDETPAKTWELVPHGADTRVEEPGETYLKLKLAAGASESLAIYNHSGTNQTWYDVLETKSYKVEVWLRQEGSGSVRFKLSGFYDTPAQAIEPVVFNVGRGWKKYLASFTPKVVQTGDQPNAMVLEFTGPATFYVDNFRVYRADAAYLDLLPHEHEIIKSSGMSALRTHAPIKTGNRTYDMEQFTNPGGVINGTAKLNTLPQTLKMMREAGVQPWLQIEFHMNPQEWLAFIEYMAAPYDPKTDTPAGKPWAFKRYRQGQIKPWVEEFGKIYFELGNETWNSLFAPWTFGPMTDAISKKNYSPGQVYGLFQEYVHSVMQSSPYWRLANLDQKFFFMLGGWAANQKYSFDAASVSTSSHFLTIAAYNGGWDEAEGPPKLDAASLFDTLAHVNQAAVPVAERYAKALLELNAHRTLKMRLGTYEAGPGYALNGLNGARVTKQQSLAQEQVMKSMAAGTATLDSFLARAYRGFSVQNFFAFDSGELWRSHAKWFNGGQAYPAWKLLALFNQEASGKMLRTETVSVPSAELKGFSRRQTIKHAPLTAVYATRKGDRFSLIVLSRKVPEYPIAGDDGYTPISVELPFDEAKSVTLYRMTGAPQANNLLSDDVRIEKLDIPSSRLNARRFALNAETGADARGLPPASTFLYVFDGVNAGKNNVHSLAE